MFGETPPKQLSLLSSFLQVLVANFDDRVLPRSSSAMHKVCYLLVAFNISYAVVKSICISLDILVISF